MRCAAREHGSGKGLLPGNSNFSLFAIYERERDGENSSCLNRFFS